jgi:hypothetical protein
MCPSCLRSTPNSGPGSPYTKGRPGRLDGQGSPRPPPGAPNGAYHAHYLPYPPGPPGAVYPHDPHALPLVSHPAAAPAAGGAPVPAPMPTNHPAAPAEDDPGRPASTASGDGLESGPDEAPAAAAAESVPETAVLKQEAAPAPSASVAAAV